MKPFQPQTFKSEQKKRERNRVTSQLNSGERKHVKVRAEGVGGLESNTCCLGVLSIWLNTLHLNLSGGELHMLRRLLNDSFHPPSFLAGVQSNQTGNNNPLASISMLTSRTMLSTHWDTQHLSQPHGCYQTYPITNWQVGAYGLEFLIILE